MTVRIITGDALETLRTLPAESVHMCCTSPPYYGLRDYGVTGQIGLEPSPDEYVAALVAVFREVRRVLRKDGTLWLNIGDSYAAQGGPGAGGNAARMGRAYQQRNVRPNGQYDSIKPKDLIGIPWMLAFALRADGWWLRQDLIWSKPNPMPESVADRPTTAHEHVFLLSKSPSYFYDAEAIKERAVADDLGSMDGGPQRLADGSNANDGRNFRIGTKGNAKTFRGGVYTQGRAFNNSGEMERDSHGNGPNPTLSRNKRSVWTVATSPFPEAHFATFPPALIEPCILAGCPSGGTVLDPFGGAGTTGLVADRLGRNAILIEINPEYVEMARRRIASDAGMFATVCSSGLPPPPIPGTLFDQIDAADD